MTGIAYEIRKNLFLPLLVISCTGIVVAALFGSFSYSMDAGNVTVMQVLFYSREKLLSNIELNRCAIFMRGVGVWSQICFPILLTIGFIYGNSYEKNSGMCLFYFVRMGRKRYCFNKIAGMLISGIIVAFLGIVLYGIFVYIKLPAPSAYGQELCERFFMMYNSGTELSIVVKFLVNIIFYAIVSSVFPYLVSLIFTDKYILVCMPVLLSYIYTSILNKLDYYAMNNGKEHLGKILEIMNPLSVISFSNGNIKYLSLGLGVISLVMLYILSIMLMKKRGAVYGLE